MYFDWEQFLANEFLGNSVKDYLWAGGAFFGSLIVLRFIKFLVMKKIRKIVDHTITKLDNLIIESIENVLSPVIYFLVGLYFASQFIEVPNFIEKGVHYILLIVLVYYATKGIQSLLEYGIKKAAKKQDREADTSVVKLLVKISKIALWVIAVLLILSNLGYNVSSLIAGLGIGGVAIAFAIQNILQDLFSSFSIYFDKPFEVGDFIIVGNDKGTVEKIGLKSTRLRTLEGQQLIISNQELTSSRVNNYKRMDRRRIDFSFGVVYSTSTEKLKKIPDIVRNIVAKIELAELDRVHFINFGDFSLNFEVVYYVNSPEYGKYRDLQQEMNLKIKEKFEQEGIEMAFPTQTINLNRNLER